MIRLKDFSCNLINKNMQNQNCKYLIIYNPLSNIGHFDSWCSIFSKIFLDEDWIVVVVTKNIKIITSELKAYKSIYNEKLILIDQTYDIYTNDKISMLEIIIKKIKILEFLNIIKLNVNTKNQSIFSSIDSLLSKAIIKISVKIECFLSKFIKSRLNISPINPIHFALDIDRLVKSLGVKPYVVLNMYLDLYNPELKVWDEFSKIMKYEWAGIHMDTKHTLIDRQYLRSNFLRVIYTINETEKIDGKNTDRSFAYHWLPDVTNVSLPSKMSQITSSIINYAAGRKIIFLGGSIGSTKNLSLWSKLISKLDHNEWYFVQIGKVEYLTLSSEDLNGLKSLLNLNIENIYIFDNYLSDESIFNEIMSISTLIWGLYRDFDRSSNILTKAALLYKPIIVSDRFLMGQRVSQYKIGITVSETSVETLINGIDWLMRNPIPLFNFQNYIKDYSTNELSNILIESLKKIS